MTESKAAQAKRERAEDRAEAKAEQAREDRAEDKAQAQLEATEKAAKVEKVVVPSPADPDPRPEAPSWSGKDEEFPAWVQADMWYKVAVSEWLARHK